MHGLDFRMKQLYMRISNIYDSTDANYDSKRNAIFTIALTLHKILPASLDFT
jgi:hypothetical protein